MSTWVIKDADGNVTNPGINATEEFVAANFDHYEALVEPELVPPTAAEVAREWRDGELALTDSISQTPDHPERDAYLAYRVALRDWPNQDGDGDGDGNFTNGFPDTRPELD